MRALTLITLLVFASWAAACSDDDKPAADSQVPDAGENINDEGCEHMTQGPFADVTAGSDIASATEVKSDHHAYRVALTASQAGYVKYAAAGAGELILFLDTNVALQIQDDQGKPLTLEKSETSIPECTVIKAKHTVDLPAVGTYFFALGPDAATTATIVIEEAGHSH